MTEHKVAMDRVAGMGEFALRAAEADVAEKISAHRFAVKVVLAEGLRLIRCREQDRRRQHVLAGMRDLVEEEERELLSQL